MDDIKGPTPNKAPVAGPPPTTPDEEEVTPMPDVPVETPVIQPEEPKGGMKTWLVVLLVVVALAIGAGGVYLWQSSSSTSDDTAALQAQLDEQAQKISDYEKATAEKTVGEKDAEIEKLTTENAALTEANTGLTANNSALTAEIAAWTNVCGSGPAPGTCTAP